MLRAERLDALVVCTPPDVHREVTVEAAQAGLAVYLEKPVAHTMDDAAAIAAAVKATGVVCAVGYQYRAISFLGDLPRGGALGSVVVGRVAEGPGWRLELIRDAGTVTVELDPVFRARGAGVDLVHSG